jgi:hypothetical protein
MPMPVLAQPGTQQRRGLLPAGVVVSLLAVPLLLASCGGPEAETGAQPVGAAVQAVSDRGYALDDVIALGWKQKGGFTRIFEGAQESVWGFLDAREVAVVVYPTGAIARDLGTAAGTSQTELTAEGRYGPNVERMKCAGFGNYRTPYRLAPPPANAGCGPALLPGGLGSSEKCALKLAPFLDGREAGESWGALPECPKRIPTYAEFVIEGNLLLLCEPKSAGNADCAGVAKRLRQP